MITNLRQYRITKGKVAEFAAALEAYDQDALVRSGVDPVIARAHAEALNSQLQEFRQELEKYDALSSTDPATIVAESLANIPIALIKARIAQGLTQKDLAEKLGLKEQQIQRYESQQYHGASFERILEVANALGLRFAAGVEPEANRIDPSKFPISEMYKRGWFENFAGSLSDAKKNAESLLEEYFLFSGQLDVAGALHRKTLTTNAFDEFALTAWQARVLMLAQTQKTGSAFNVERISRDWVHELVKMSQAEAGPLKAASFLVDSGIHFIVEEHLLRTRLDGASMLGIDGTPIVAMTLRYDRIDNFWFTLLHEIGHIVQHVATGEYSAIFDDTDQPAENDIEKEADEFALEALVSSEDWKRCVSRFAMSEAAVVADAKRIGISPAIIAGRIRNEIRDYTKFSNLVGNGQVKALFRRNTEL